MTNNIALVYCGQNVTDIPVGGYIIKTNSVIVTIACLLPLGTYAGKVSIGDEKITGRIRGETIKEVTVLCAQDATPRILVKKGYEASWCDTKIGDTCHREKARAARKICSADYTLKLAQQNENTIEKQATDKSNKAPAETESLSADERYKLKQEKFQIEQELIKISQRKLQLRKLKLDLQKMKQQTT